MMEFILGGLIVTAFILLYFSGKRAGKVEQKNEQLARILQSQSSVQGTIDAQLSRFDEKMQKLERKVYGMDIHLLSDNQLNQLWKADPQLDIQTNPESVEESETK